MEMDGNCSAMPDPHFTKLNYSNYRLVVGT